MAEAVAIAAKNFKTYRSPKTVIGRFIAKRTYKSASLWALIFGVYMAQKTLGFAQIAPTQAARAKIASSFSNNVGINALLGTPHHVDTLAGYANWNTLGVITIVASIWAFLLATKYVRGEEDNGRNELMLAGQTTARKAAINQLIGLGSSFFVMFLLTALLFIYIGKDHTLNFSTTGSLNFALATVSGAALFMAIGSLTSQLMPTRSRASSLAAIIFGVAFLVRAAADVTSLHWLLNLTPLGWIERLQPLVGSSVVWYIPIFGSTLAIAGISVYLAGKRDLDASIVPDKDTAKAHTKLLNSPFWASLRLNRPGIIGWLAAIGFTGFLYGVLTKAAVQAFNQAASFQKLQKGLDKLVGINNISISLLYLSVIFLLLTALIMAYAASSVSRIREDEAQGYIDNFLVRPVSRTRWLLGRIGLVIVISIAACLVGSLSVWIGQAIQHGGASFNILLQAGLNMVAAVIFVLACGIFAFGIVPRLTSLVAYGVLGWSFLLYFIGSGLNLNHWLMDSSVFRQLALAPASKPNWTTNLIILGISLGLMVIGGFIFYRRDLQVE